MNLNLIADQIVKGRIYPALARHQARPYTQAWREFGQHWPYTTPLRLQEYCNQHSVPINIFSIHDVLPSNTFYPIGIGFFDFDIDYFELLNDDVQQRLRHGDFRLLFYYHEGDNPARIKDRLDALVEQHCLPADCYVFVSANSAADELPGFVTFHDFELWYYQRNLASEPLHIHSEPRERDFTCLSRIHKSWRATVMADMWQNGLLDNSYWSYCETAENDDHDCPIEIDMISVRSKREQFLVGAPYISDELDFDQRNDHSVLVPKYHANSYCNIVLESQFDVDQSSGCFITEKTFKPIKHGQMFFVAGGAGSLQALRDLGYRVFDGVLDNRYDQEPNHTFRWIKLCESIQAAKKMLPELFEQCRADIEHNQQLFQSSKAGRLNKLLESINEQHR
jgi:hypothetical protein